MMSRTGRLVTVAVSRLVRFFSSLGSSCRSRKATNLEDAADPLSKDHPSALPRALESDATTRKEPYQPLHASGQTSPPAPREYISADNSHTSNPSMNAANQKSNLPTWTDRINVACSVFDASTPLRAEISSASMKPRGLHLAFCLLWIILTTVATVESPQSMLLLRLWQASFVLPQLGWIAIPLLIGWGDSYSSNSLANIEAHIRATEDPQNNQTDGGALCDASCSASSFDVQAVYENTKKSMEELERLHQEVMKTHQFIIDDCERVLHRERQ